MSQEQLIKLNLGCGFQKQSGFINVDKDTSGLPDVQVHLVQQSWPWDESSVDEVQFLFSMEQMGQTVEDLEYVVRELYRVCKNGAKVFIKSFHPRHDQFFLNPLCTQRISPDFFHLLSISRNLNMIATGQHDDVLGMKWGVNFAVTNFRYLLSAHLQKEVEEGRLSEDELKNKMRHEHNICHVFEVELKALKDG